MQLLIGITLIIFALMACAGSIKETPETKEPDICQALKGPHPKKEVQIQPYCPDETPTPTPTKTPRRVEK